MTNKTTESDKDDFRGYLRNCSDAQVKGVWEKETQANRRTYAALAIAEAERRNISTTDWVKPGRRRFEDTEHH